MDAHYTITREPARNGIRLLLNGKFDEGSLPDLEVSIAQAQEADSPVYVDLSEVTLVDRKAVQYFSERASRTVLLVNCPAYLRHWIKEVSDVES